MLSSELKIGLLLRYIGKDRLFAESFWRVVDINGSKLSLSDIRGVSVTTYSMNILSQFEPFIPPDDEARIKWKTKYLGVVQ